MSNFQFLMQTKEYALFAPAAVEAEKVFVSSPAMCAVGCRKALELAVKWVYSADSTMSMPYKNNLQSLIHELSFRFAVDEDTWGKLPYIIKTGNNAVHTGKTVTPAEALASLRGLFEFVLWIDYCYGEEYTERRFDEALIPKEKVFVDTKRIKEQESLLGEKDAEIEALRKEIAQMSAKFTAAKEEHKSERTFSPEDISEFDTRRLYIDVDLKEAGWRLDGTDADVVREYEVDGMQGIPGQKGYADYVLFGRDGLPLAVVEAKRTCREPQVGETQARLYADCLERKFGRRPVIFVTNGFETYYWDDLSSPKRKVSGIFGKDDLQKLINRRSDKKDLKSVPINDKITDRYYQKEAIRAVCESIGKGFRKHLLVMATGTGKTRTAASLTDVLSRGGYITNVLFLADRTALVKQAKDDFKKHLPEMSLCNLCTNKDDAKARIVFSTYPTILNAIDNAKSKDGQRIFTPAHFDLIIVDESHRSIFKKYRAIFRYFDAITVGLTATPKTEVDRNTYEFFDMEHGVPTYAYDYDTAVEQDHVLVPYYNYEVKTLFLDEGITYDDLSDEDKARYEEDFAEDGVIPEFIPSNALNDFVFNKNTVDTVIQDLMTRGIKVAGGDRLGKTIIFAQKKQHAEFIVERFNALYPHYNGTFAKRVVCDDSYAQSTIDDFKFAEKEPHIAVSVDMMDTGIDVPEVVNLVFFKKVRSKAKFWQMIGRGTRLCPELCCIDEIDKEYTGKRRFLIFDYCGNFEFFRQKKAGYETADVKSLSENIFGKRIKIAAILQQSVYSGDNYQTWRKELIDTCHGQINGLNPELLEVKLQLRQVEKYKDKTALDCIGESDKCDLLQHIAPIVRSDDNDELSKRFDNFMYGLILTAMEDGNLNRTKRELCKTAAALEKKATIPQIKEKLPIIKSVGDEALWEAKDILRFEGIRSQLRELIKFLDAPSQKIIITDIKDEITERRSGEVLEPAYDFADYRDKVTNYIKQNGNILAIFKLTHNQSLTAGDFEQLEKVLTTELGSAEDYKREFGDTPLGRLVRNIAGMDHDATMAAFSHFINDESLNQSQIDFVHRIINHIEKNGYIEKSELLKTPFDRPVSFVKLFDKGKSAALIDTINKFNLNAVESAI